MSSHHGNSKVVGKGSAASSALRIAHLMAISMATALCSGLTCDAPVHLTLYASKLALNSASSAYMLKIAFRVWIEVQRGGKSLSCHA